MDQSFYQYPNDMKSSMLRIRKKRRTVEVQKGGLVIQVPHKDRTTGIRKVQVKPIQSTSAVIWSDPKGRKGNVQISLKRPKAIQKFLKEHPISDNAQILGEVERGQTIKWHGRFYRVKELSETGIIIVPENFMPKLIMNNMNVSEVRPLLEFRLGKAELARQFSSDKA